VAACFGFKCDSVSKPLTEVRGSKFQVKRRSKPAPRGGRAPFVHVRTEGEPSPTEGGPSTSVPCCRLAELGLLTAPDVRRRVVDLRSRGESEPALDASSSAPRRPFERFFERPHDAPSSALRRLFERASTPLRARLDAPSSATQASAPERFFQNNRIAFAARPAILLTTRRAFAPREAARRHRPIAAPASA
jgi:hypothetical protein